SLAGSLPAGLSCSARGAHAVGPTAKAVPARSVVCMNRLRSIIVLLSMFEGVFAALYYLNPPKNSDFGNLDARFVVNSCLMFEAKAIRKSYGRLVAVDGVSLTAAAGETIGLLGPNGAGKTTTVSMIAGLVKPDSGEVCIEGRPLAGDTDPLKLKLGLVP